MFESQADQRRQFALLADRRELDTTIIQQPHRVYHRAAGQADQRIGTPDAQSVGPVSRAAGSDANPARAT
jgi:hypothetical protein